MESFTDGALVYYLLASFRLSVTATKLVSFIESIVSYFLCTYLLLNRCFSIVAHNSILQNFTTASFVKYKKMPGQGANKRPDLHGQEFFPIRAILYMVNAHYGLLFGANVHLFLIYANIFTSKIHNMIKAIKSWIRRVFCYVCSMKHKHFHFHFNFNNPDQQTLVNKIDLLMSKVEEIQQQVVTLTQQVDSAREAITAEQQQVAEAVNGFNTQIALLNEQIANGATNEALQAIADGLAEANAKLTSARLEIADIFVPAPAPVPEANQDNAGSGN